MIQTETSHPLARINDLSFFGGCDNGMNLVGKFLLVDYALDDDTVLITWDYELKAGVTDTEVGVYIFSNGTLIDIAGMDEKVYALKMGLLQKRSLLDLYILPRSDLYKYIGYPLFGIIKDRVSLVWEQNGGASKVKVVYGSTEVPDTVLHTFNTPVARVITSTTTSGAVLHVGGNWRDPSVLYTEFDIVISAAGSTCNNSNSVVETGNAIYSCTWTHDGSTQTFIGKTSTVGQELFNGLILWWDEGTTDMVLGDSWTVQIGLQNNYTTRPLDEGNYSFKTTSVGPTGNITDSTVLYPVRVNVPPEPLVISDIDRPSGSNEITFYLDIPNDDTISHVKLYRNRIFTNTLIPHWVPDYFMAATANTTVELGAIKDLAEGTNVFVFRTVDRDGIESSDVVYTLILDENLEELLETPPPPESIKASVLTNGDISVTVIVNRDATLVSIYSSAGSSSRGAAINYTTPITTISGISDEEDNQSFTAAISVASDGYYTFGARCTNVNVEETNTDITVEVYRDTSSPEANTNLSATVVV